MCTLFEEIAKEGEEKGRLEGRAEEIVGAGFDFNLSEKDILDRLQLRLNISLPVAQEYLMKFGGQP